MEIILGSLRGPEWSLKMMEKMRKEKTGVSFRNPIDLSTVRGQYLLWPIAMISLTATSVIQRQMFLLHGNPEKGQRPDPKMTPARAYDQARKEFYEMRLQQDIERRVAREEAMATGAYFGKSTLQIGMELEDKIFEEWKAWASAEVIQQEQRRAAMYTGVDNETAALSEGEQEMEAALGEVDSTVPAQGQEARGSAAFVP